MGVGERRRWICLSPSVLVSVAFVDVPRQRSVLFLYVAHDIRARRWTMVGLIVGDVSLILIAQFSFKIILVRCRTVVVSDPWSPFLAAFPF